MNKKSEKTSFTGAFSFLVMVAVSSYLCGTFVTQVVISPTPPATLWLAIANGAFAIVAFIRVLLCLKRPR